MPELKINKVPNTSEDVPMSAPIAAKSDEVETMFKKEEVQKRKLFANKKANIALIIVGGFIVLGFIAWAIIRFAI